MTVTSELARSVLIERAEQCEKHAVGYQKLAEDAEASAAYDRKLAAKLREDARMLRNEANAPTQSTDDAA